MTIEALRNLFKRDINRLYREIEMYSNDAALWKKQDAINNSAGNLCLHLVGNLNTYIGKELGGIAYTRDRDTEFSARDISRRQLLNMINDLAD